jgi:hypothetical protein
MAAFIEQIVPYYWLVCSGVIVCNLYIRAPWSTTFSLLVWVVLGVCMDMLMPVIMALDITLARQLWYWCWIIIYCTIVLVIIIAHQQRGESPTLLCRTVCHSAFAMMVLQMLRYLDRMIIKTDILHSVYQFGVPAINFAVAVAALYWLGRTVNITKGNK